MTSTSVTICFV